MSDDLKFDPFAFAASSGQIGKIVGGEIMTPDGDHIAFVAVKDGEFVVVDKPPTFSDED